ncbi:hypothetical protein L207DRAFT_166457 [Hyaloscypha variabilis F]|uniref:Uncharacterized protein n=1 Tax=Hyaloscypha variabilis (strain UAMH 11265 / GT02V1 / F) TaxID=1149755 RepID=A0A2J6SB17_HYAVF|nr:hypothetical protein L207DRAFT_166457 [Hyaloscypha variabilis F]
MRELADIPIPVPIPLTLPLPFPSHARTAHPPSLGHTVIFQPGRRLTDALTRSRTLVIDHVKVCNTAPQPLARRRIHASRRAGCDLLSLMACGLSVEPILASVFSASSMLHRIPGT